MDPVEHALHVVEGPVVDQAEALDHAECVRPSWRWVASAGGRAGRPAGARRAGSGLRGWARRTGAVLRRTGRDCWWWRLIAALPMHFFVGRVDDTVVAAPALSDLAGGFGLLLLPADVAGLLRGLRAAAGDLPGRHGRGGGSRGGRRRACPARGRCGGWWPTGCARCGSGSPRSALLAQALPLAAQRRPARARRWSLRWRSCLGLGSTAVLTAVGVLGCVALIERGRGLRRARAPVSIAPTGGLIGRRARAHRAAPARRRGRRFRRGEPGRGGLRRAVGGRGPGHVRPGPSRRGAGDQRVAARASWPPPESRLSRGVPSRPRKVAFPCTRPPGVLNRSLALATA